MTQLEWTSDETGDQTWLFSTGGDGTVKVWDPRSGDLLKTYQGKKDAKEDSAHFD